MNHWSHRYRHLLEDQHVVERRNIAPNRQVITIDVGRQTPEQQMETVQRWKAELRKKQLPTG